MAIYFRIESYSSDWEDNCCGEPMAICPDCGTPVCVFCYAGCEGCHQSVF